MVERGNGGIVRSCVAASSDEIERLVAAMPVVVTRELTAELEVAGIALRYDLESERAFAFERRNGALHCWIWHDVRDYEEAGRVLTAIVAADGPLHADLAHQVYAEATGRGG